MYVSRTRELFYKNTKRLVTLWKVRNTMCSCSMSEPKLKSVFNGKVSVSKSRGNLDFKKLVLEAVDEGLSLLGECSKQALFSYLDSTFKIKKQDIPEKIEEFTNAIERIFGNGAKLLEIEILRQLCKKVEHNFEYTSKRNDSFFIDYVEAVRDCTNATERVPFPKLLNKFT